MAIPPLLFVVVSSMTCFVGFTSLGTKKVSISSYEWGWFNVIDVSSCHTLLVILTVVIPSGSSSSVRNATLYAGPIHDSLASASVTSDIEGQASSGKTKASEQALAYSAATANNV